VNFTERTRRSVTADRILATTISISVRIGIPQPVFDAEGQDELDVTSATMLKGLVAELRAGGLAVFFTNVHAPVLERARQSGLLDAIGDESIYPTLDLAVQEAARHASTLGDEERAGGGS
jgi:hypothetical protein